jgi:hypothetical protein
MASKHQHIRKKRQNGEIAASLVVFVEKTSNVAQNMRNKGIKAALVRQQAEVFTNLGHVSLCILGRGWANLENKCCRMPKCG